MGQLQHLLGFILVALICVKTGYAISCYDCNSATDKRCLGDENRLLPEDLKKNCPHREGKQYSLCRKIKQVIDFEVNGLKPDSRIIRTCGFEDSSYANKCYQRSGFGGRQEVCACETDNCNGSTRLTMSLATVLAPLLLLKLRYV